MKLFLLLFFSVSLCAQAGQEKNKSNKNMCPPGQHWVRAHHRSDYFRDDGTYVSDAFVRAHCSTNPAGFDYWMPRIHNNGPTDWPLKNEKEKPWSDSEIERLVEALAHLPESLAKLKIIDFYRMDKSNTPANPASMKNRSVVLYDAAFKNNNLARIVAHELAHQYYFENPGEQKRYNTASGWFFLDDSKPVNVRGTFVADDGRDSPDEDYANNVEFFIFQPDRLKQISPGIYDWMKNIHGNEFKLKGGKQ